MATAAHRCLCDFVRHAAVRSGEHLVAGVHPVLPAGGDGIRTVAAGYTALTCVDVRCVPICFCGLAQPDGDTARYVCVLPCARFGVALVSAGIMASAAACGPPDCALFLRHLPLPHPGDRSRPVVSARLSVGCSRAGLRGDPTWCTGAAVPRSGTTHDCDWVEAGEANRVWPGTTGGRAHDEHRTCTVALATRGSLYADAPERLHRCRDQARAGNATTHKVRRRGQSHAWDRCNARLCLCN